MRLSSKLAAIALGCLTVGTAFAPAPWQAQTSWSNETWSADKMAYVTVPCTNGLGQAASKGAATANCGIETWSTDKQMYVGTPCPGGTTYENPSASASENFNAK